MRWSLHVSTTFSFGVHFGLIVDIGMGTRLVSDLEILSLQTTLQAGPDQVTMQIVTPLVMLGVEIKL